jgi:hypothetical protein
MQFDKHKISMKWWIKKDNVKELRFGFSFYFNIDLTYFFLILKKS